MTPKQVFVFADDARDTGDYATAEAAYRGLATNPDIELRTEARFRLALMLADKKKRYADAAVLLTVPTGCLLYVARGYWEITADWTGGSSSAIGLSSSQTVGIDHSTKGDLLGGSAGNVAAALTATIGTSEGTIGTDMAAGPGVILRAASTVRFDRITSAFTAGTGNAHLVCTVLKNPGA